MTPLITNQSLGKIGIPQVVGKWLLEVVFCLWVKLVTKKICKHQMLGSSEIIKNAMQARNCDHSSFLNIAAPLLLVRECLQTSQCLLHKLSRPVKLSRNQHKKHTFDNFTKWLNQYTHWVEFLHLK